MEDEGFFRMIGNTKKGSWWSRRFDEKISEIDYNGCASRQDNIMLHPIWWHCVLFLLYRDELPIFWRRVDSCPFRQIPWVEETNVSMLG